MFGLIFWLQRITSEGPFEKCLLCGEPFPVYNLREHIATAHEQVCCSLLSRPGGVCET